MLSESRVQTWKCWSMKGQEENFQDNKSQEAPSPLNISFQCLKDVATEWKMKGLLQSV